MHTSAELYEYMIHRFSLLPSCMPPGPASTTALDYAVPTPAHYKTLWAIWFSDSKRRLPTPASRVQWCKENGNINPKIVISFFTKRRQVAKKEGLDTPDSRQDSYDMCMAARALDLDHKQEEKAYAGKNSTIMKGEEANDVDEDDASGSSDDGIFTDTTVHPTSSSTPDTSPIPSLAPSRKIISSSSTVTTRSSPAIFTPHKKTALKRKRTRASSDSDDELGDVFASSFNTPSTTPDYPRRAEWSSLPPSSPIPSSHSSSPTPVYYTRSRRRSPSLLPFSRTPTPNPLHICTPSTPSRQEARIHEDSAPVSSQPHVIKKRKTDHAWLKDLNDPLCGHECMGDCESLMRGALWVKGADKRGWLVEKDEEEYRPSVLVDPVSLIQLLPENYSEHSGPPLEDFTGLSSFLAAKHHDSPPDYVTVTLPAPKVPLIFTNRQAPGAVVWEITERPNADHHCTNTLSYASSSATLDSNADTQPALKDVTHAFANSRSSAAQYPATALTPTKDSLSSPANAHNQTSLYPFTLKPTYTHPELSAIPFIDAISSLDPSVIQADRLIWRTPNQCYPSPFSHEHQHQPSSLQSSRPLKNDDSSTLAYNVEYQAMELDGQVFSMDGFRIGEADEFRDDAYGVMRVDMGRPFVMGGGEDEEDDGWYDGDVWETFCEEFLGRERSGVEV